MRSLPPRGAIATLMDRLGRRGRGGSGELPVCRGARGIYRLESVLHAGGSSAVFLAREVGAGAPVALKALLDRPADGTERVRFDTELHVLRTLRHPNIVSVLDTGRIASQPFYVMDHAARGSLGAWIRDEGPIPGRDAVRFTLEVLDALAYAHQRGVVHRDVKPDNIVVDAQGVARLVDFGIALAPTRQQVPSYGENVGTPAYIAPEQADDPSRAGPAADLFALGATLYALVTGGNPLGLLSSSHRDAALARLSPPIAAVVEVATRPFANDRFVDARQMALALADALEATDPTGD